MAQVRPHRPSAESRANWTGVSRSTRGPGDRVLPILRVTDLDTSLPFYHDQLGVCVEWIHPFAAASRPARRATRPAACGPGFGGRSDRNDLRKSCDAEPNAKPAGRWVTPVRGNCLRVYAVGKMGLGRVELPTSRLSGVRSNHLSYRPHPRTIPDERVTMNVPPCRSPRGGREYPRA